MATTSSGADPAMVNKIASHLKSQGIFDQFRRDCLEDVDTKPAYQNLRQKVESYVSSFLSKVKWEPKMNKNQLRDSLRRQINQSEMLSTGVERIIEQVIEPKMYHVFRPQIEKVVDEFLCPEKDKDVESVKKDLESTSGWQGDTHLTSAPVPPDLPPRVPTPAPPLPPSEPPAAPPEEPPEAPPDSPPEEPDEMPGLSKLHPGTSPAAERSITPTFPSGGNTPSSTSSKGRETPNLLKKQSGGLPQVSVDVKAERKSEASSEGINKPSSQSIKGHIGKSMPGKDQGTKKLVGKDNQPKIQPAKVIKKVELGLKDKPKTLAAGTKIADSAKPKVSIPGKSAVSKMKTVADKREGQSPKQFEKDVFVTITQSLRDSELDKKPTSDQLLEEKVHSEEIEPLKQEVIDPQELSDKSPSVCPVLILNLKSVLNRGVAESKDDADQVTVDSDDVEMASGGDESDGESGLSDISVSSVHTSDLSSFDEGISSTSSSSSGDSSSEEESEPKLIMKKKKPRVNVCPSDSDSEAPSEGPSVSTDTSRPASVSSERTSARRSPKGQTVAGRALAISRYHGDSEDEDSRQERRKKAALAKEERARRRQLAKEEREKVVMVTRSKRAIDSESVEELSDSKKGKMDEVVSPTKATKKQLKEQKMLEKKREVRRRRSLNKRYFSDEFSSSMQGLKETVSQQEDDEGALQQNIDQTEFIPFIRKEKLQCFHLVYRERREPQVRSHHLLNQALSGEQQRKLSTRKRKEKKDSKISRFSFGQTKVTAGTSSEARGKQIASGAQWVDEKEKVSELQQQQREQEMQQQQQKQEEQEMQQQQQKQEQQQQQQQQLEQQQLEQHEKQQLEQKEQKQQQQQEQQQQQKQQQQQQQQQQPEDIKEECTDEKEVQQPPKKEKTQAQQVEDNLLPEPETVDKPPDMLHLPEEVLSSVAEQNQPSKEEQEQLCKEGVEQETKMDFDVQSTEKYEQGGEQEVEKPIQDLEKWEEEKKAEVHDEGKDAAGEKVEASAENLEEGRQQDNTVEEIISSKLDSSEAEEVVDETQMKEALDKVEPMKGDQSQDDTHQKGTSQVENSKERMSEETVLTSGTIPIQHVTDTVENMEAAASINAPPENTSDDNPPTPTQDEPSIYSDADSESEEQSDKGSSIPIYTVHSPKHLPLGSIFKLSQTSLQDVKPVGSRVGEVRTLSKDSSASGSDDAQDPETERLEEEHFGSNEGNTDISESNRDSDKQVPKETHAELHDKSSTSEISEPSQPESRYGTRPKRHAVSPRDSLDDDYYYYGQSKRGRFSQSPVSQDEPVKPGRSVTRRVSTDSGKSEGTSRESSDRPTRPSRQRRVSPPHRYSPSETRSSQRRSSTSSPHPPTAPSMATKQTRRGSSPSSHEHFTRRSSGREEVKRGNRYSDMYYYNDRGSRNQPSTRGGDRGRASEPINSRRSSRRSVDDRAGNQTKRRK